MTPRLPLDLARLSLPRLGLACLLALSMVAQADTPFRDPPHNYFQQEGQDAFSKLAAKMASGEVQLDNSSEKARLVSLLKALNVPISSQLWVFSATSFQSALIHASNPRALYFNDEVYVGYVPGGKLEIVAIDGTLGPVFQIIEPRGDRLETIRTERCMNCHAGRAMRSVPGFFAESVIPMQGSGASLEGFRRELVGHTIPLKDRLGGWHVTGAHEKSSEHLGNLLGENGSGGVRRFANPPGKFFDIADYPGTTSDLLTHLLHEHQLGFHNHVTQGLYRTREALTAGNGRVRSEDAAKLNELAREFVRYLLFANEARLPSGGVKPDPAYLKDFMAARKALPNGASLRDLDLRSRLQRYRCSYMIYTPGFAALPEDYLTRVMAGLASALRETGGPAEFSYIPADEKRAIKAILQATLPLWK